MDGRRRVGGAPACLIEKFNVQRQLRKLELTKR